MFKKFSNKKNTQLISDEGSWDAVWEQKSTFKKLNFLRKAGYFYISASGLLSKYINKHIKSDKKYTILEIGCGGSSYLPYLQKRYKNLKIFGLDKSMEGCKSTLFSLKKDTLLGGIVCGDIFKSPFCNKFDIVFSVGLIEHFDEPKLVIEKHLELLKPGGLLICIIPNFIGFQGSFFKMNVWRKSSRESAYSKDFIWGIKTIDVSELKSWLENLHLTKVKVHSIGGFFPFLMMESYNRDIKSVSIKFIYFFYRIFLFLPIIIINIPFIFRLNLLSFSPLIIGTGLKRQ
ncbi:MAG: class I SAM-dependent methyltransferase [Candidatus Thermoplasmatota archaeon]|jgi:SAM-dependent methyltransferase|nr:class I SAM-dependent methyltransferase [Candidatus Thermoplasmatota archaeon]